MSNSNKKITPDDTMADEEVQKTEELIDILADETTDEESIEDETAEGTVQSETPDEMEKMRLEVEQYKSQYLRAVADYRNLERRVMEERKDLIPTIKANTIEAFLPVVDNLDKAELFIKDPGLKMIKDQFMQTLQDIGVREVELLNTKFDPHTAEAIEVVDGDADDTVVKVSRKAYKLGDRVLQHGLVTVSKKQTN